MIIAFITDLHLPSIGELARGVDTHLHFHMILKDLKKFPINHIVIGGDISFKAPESTVNEYVKYHLDQLKIPYNILPGNHDSIEQLKSCFYYPNRHQEEIYYVKQIQDQYIVFLDSSSKRLGAYQLEWLDEILTNIPSCNLVMIHHPVLKGAVPYMDKNHALQNSRIILEMLLKQNRNIHIFSGHYHVEKCIVHKNIIQHITPSLFIQINQFSQDFVIDHTVPGYRLIESKTNILRTHVRYVQP